MGKAVIIKGADFQANSLGRVEEMYEDITDKFIQGFGSVSGGAVTIYNNSYNSSSSTIPNFLMFMEDSTTLYDTRGKGVEIFLPTGLKMRPWVYKHTSTIGSGGKVSDSYGAGTNLFFTGADTWITADEIYALISASAETYDCFSGNVSLVNSGALTLAAAKQMGFKVRQIKQTP
jgi:hypothetical protein